MASDTKGLFSQFGLPVESQEEILTRRTKERNTAIRERMTDSLAAANPRDRDAFAGGQALGKLLGKAFPDKFGPEPATLTEAEERRQKIVEGVRSRFEAFNSDPKNATLDIGKKQQKFNEFMAEEAFANGDVELGQQMLERAAAAKTLHESQQANLKKAGLEIEAAREELDQSRTKGGYLDESLRQGLATGNARLINERMKGVQTMWMRGETDPTKGFTGIVDPLTGTVNINGNILPIGDFVLTAPPDPTKGSGGSTDLTPTISQKEAAMVRDRMNGLATQTQEAQRMLQILRREQEEQGGEINILGTAGKATSFAKRLMDSSTAMFRQLRKADTYSIPIIDSSGKAVKDPRFMSYRGRDAYLKDAGVDVETILQESGLEDSARNSEELAALIVNMAYAQARMNEPGNTRLSDTDYKLALRQVGADATDPEALVRIMHNNLDANLQSTKTALSLFPDHELEHILPGGARNNVLTSTEAFVGELYGTEAGTAAESTLPEQINNPPQASTQPPGTGGTTPSAPTSNVGAASDAANATLDALDSVL